MERIWIITTNGRKISVIKSVADGLVTAGEAKYLADVKETEIEKEESENDYSETFTLAELKKIATKRGIQYTKRVTKPELLALLEGYDGKPIQEDEDEDDDSN